MIKHIKWTERATLSLLDQRKLPGEISYVECMSAEETADAIASMVVRGAPAIGITAAYGLAMAGNMALHADENLRSFQGSLKKAAKILLESRPTAVNLGWALDRQLKLAKDLSHMGAHPEDISDALREEAVQIHEADIASCRAIGQHASPFVPEKATILTHCNAGALATGGYGTALGVIRAAVEAGKKIGVIADETRPFLQGARLTAWELQQDGIDVTIICDSAAGALMAGGKVDLVVVGADRIAANGDTANKIGTSSLATLAARHEIPFYVAAPLSTFDRECKDGKAIPIENRAPDEVLSIGGVSIAPDGVPALNPAFDVTPHEDITAIITEKGAVSPVNPERVEELLAKAIP